MKRKPPVPPNEKKLRRKLTEMAEQVRAFLSALDAEMAKPSSPERGHRIALLSNALNMYNDGVRYFWCNVDYRKDYRKDAPLRATDLIHALELAAKERTS